MYVPLRETPAYQKGLHIARFFAGAEYGIRVLDCGAGSNPGLTGQALLDQGCALDSYEPYRSEAAKPKGKYQLVVAIEVLECP